MKSLLCLLAIPALALAAAPAFAKPINYTTAVKPNDTIRFQSVAGSVKIETWKQDKVQITGTLCQECKNHVERTSTGLDIRIIRPRRDYYYSNYHDRGSHLVIRLPASVHLQVNTVSADISADGLTGSVRLESVSGEIGLQSKSADISVQSVSGDTNVDGSAAQADVSVQSISGEVKVHAVGGQLRLESVSGDIELDTSNTVSEGRFDTTSGDILFTAALAAEGEYDFHSTSGDIALELPKLPAARFDAASLSGDINVNFGPSPQRTSEYGPGMEWHYQSGSGDADVDVSTTSGDIHIRAPHQ